VVRVYYAQYTRTCYSFKCFNSENNLRALDGTTEGIDIINASNNHEDLKSRIVIICEIIVLLLVIE